MAVAVGIAIEQYDRLGRPVERERLPRIGSGCRRAENALAGRGGFRGGQVGVPPGREQDFHRWDDPRPRAGSVAPSRFTPVERTRGTAASFRRGARRFGLLCCERLVDELLELFSGLEV